MAAELIIEGHFVNSVSIRSWKEMRDEGVVKQHFDYSCGAAALSGLLTSLHGEEVGELEIIDRIGIKDAFSMTDLARAAEELGFRSVGLALDYDMLMRFKRPVIVYLDYWDEGHFSVLAGIDQYGVWLADPAWGNVRMRRERFERFWRGRSVASGKVLALLPGANVATRAAELAPLSGSGLAIPPVDARGFFDWNGIP